ncbi:helicase HerA domain-containing protein, partial [Chloroflexota bacterium]
PLFAAAVRLAASSEELVSRIERSFLRQYDGADNGLVSIRSFYPINGIMNRETHTYGMIANLEEVSSLLHLPDPEDVPSILQRASVTAPPPAMATEDILVPLGTNQHGGREISVGIPPSWLPRHCLLVGGTGYGKSTTLCHMVSALAAAGYGLMFIDPHGDTAETCLKLMPEDRIDDVIYFNSTDMSYPPSLNIFAHYGGRDRYMDIRTAF